jgi:hypothetical protein
MFISIPLNHLKPTDDQKAASEITVSPCLPALPFTFAVALKPISPDSILLLPVHFQFSQSAPLSQLRRIRIAQFQSQQKLTPIQ